MTDDAADTAEFLLAEVSETLTAPTERECLPCYLQRMLAQFGCDNTLRWAMRWRDRNAPRATALHGRLESRGGYCDCEVLLNVYPQTLPEDETAGLAPCNGVSRKGSTKPCLPLLRPPYGPAPVPVRASDLGYAWSSDGLRLIVPVTVTHPADADLQVDHWAEVGPDNGLFREFVRWAAPHPRWPEAGSGFTTDSWRWPQG